MQDGQIYERSIPDLPMFLVNTGLPASSTGECVEAAAPYFQQSSIGQDFADITQAMDNAFSAKNLPAAIETILGNHDLLVKINVVPPTVQQFIAEIKEQGGGAKICGAGSITGEKAGVVLVVTEHEADLLALCERHQYTMLPIAGEPRGVHVS